MTDFVVQAPPLDDEDAMQSLRELCLDVAGVALAGSREISVQLLLEAMEVGSEGRCVLIGRMRRASPSSAALINGVAAHALDFDDTIHPAGAHPSAVIWPALLAVGEARGKSGLELLDAYAVGLCVVNALGAAMSPSHYERGWHSTAVFGALGAAAAASRLLKLDSDQTAHALGIGSSLASGLRRNVGSMSKHLQVGAAAQNAVLAATLASSGFTAGAQVLTGPNGFFDLFAGADGVRTDRAIALLDSPVRDVMQGLTIKGYAACGTIQPAIAAALQLRSTHGLVPDNIKEIECRVNPFVPDILITTAPRTGTEAQFSLEYALAVAFIDGEAGLPQFSDERVKAGDTATLANKVRVVRDAELANGRTPAGQLRQWPARVSVKLVGGPDITSQVDLAPGKWAGTRFTWTELVDKFNLNVARVGMSPNRAAELVAVIRELETLDSISKLASTLTISE